MASLPNPPRLGISGRLARTFQANPLTPILALLGLLLGLVAVMITPREEEPQIDVTMANVIVPFPGADARQVEQMVTYPLEQKLSEIEEIKHTYSISRPGMAVLTVEFDVGVKRQPALVRLYDKVFSNQDWMPANLGVGQPIIKPKGADPVDGRSAARRTRPGRSGPHAGNRTQAHPRHARRVHPGCAGACRHGAARCGATGQPWPGGE